MASLRRTADLAGHEAGGALALALALALASDVQGGMGAGKREGKHGKAANGIKAGLESS